MPNVLLHIKNELEEGNDMRPIYPSPFPHSVLCHSTALWFCMPVAHPVSDFRQLPPASWCAAKCHISGCRVKKNIFCSSQMQKNAQSAWVRVHPPLLLMVWLHNGAPLQHVTGQVLPEASRQQIVLFVALTNLCSSCSHIGPHFQQNWRDFYLKWFESFIMMWGLHH